MNGAEFPFFSMKRDDSLFFCSANLGGVGRKDRLLVPQSYGYQSLVVGRLKPVNH